MSAQNRRLRGGSDDGMGTKHKFVYFQVHSLVVSLIEGNIKCKNRLTNFVPITSISNKD